MMSKESWLAGAAAVAILAATGAAQAGGFALREQSAVGLGNSFAGAAAGGSGLASMFWNPATMTNFAGMQSSMSLFAIVPNASITPTTGTFSALTTYGGTASSGDIGQDALLPASYSSWQIGDKVWLGLSVNTPYGLVTQNPNNWAGQIYGRTSKVATMNATPTIAYQVNDMLSLGFGVQIMQTKVRLTQATSFLADAPSAELKGDGTALGLTAGATFKPVAGTEIGIGYRSQVKPKLEGTLYNPTGPATYNIKSDIILPDQVTIGLRQKVSDNLTLLAGFEWTRWSSFGRFPVLSTSGTQLTSLDFDYKNSTFTSIGAEYAWNKNLVLRAGLGFEKSPITNATRSVRLPDSDRIWTSLGMGYQWNEKLTFDASYAHLFAKSGSINVVPGNPSLITAPSGPPLYSSQLTFVGNTKARVDILAVGFTYRWDEPKKAAPAKLPLVTKG